MWFSLGTSSATVFLAILHIHHLSGWFLRWYQLVTCAMSYPLQNFQILLSEIEKLSSVTLWCRKFDSNVDIIVWHNFSHNLVNPINFTTGKRFHDVLQSLLAYENHRLFKYLYNWRYAISIKIDYYKNCCLPFKLISSSTMNYG